MTTNKAKNKSSDTVPTDALLASLAIERVCEAMGIVEYRLTSNNLKVLLAENHATPNVSTMILYRVGSRNEAVGYTGATHFLEHMMFKGTDKFDYVARLKPLGGTFNATTSYDRTNYFTKVTSKGLPLVIAMEADRMRSLVLRKDHRDSEMGVVHQELDNGKNNPFAAVREQLMAVCLQQHPYHHPVIGYAMDVENVPLERLQAFYNTFYYPNNACFMVSGDFNSADTLKLIAQHFGPLSASPAPIPEVYTFEPAQEGVRRFEVSRVSTFPAFSLMGFRTPGAAHKDNLALAAISAILGDSNRPSSRLYKATIATGKAVEVFCSTNSLRDDGPFLIGGVLGRSGNYDKLEAILLAELNRLAREPVPEEELNRIKIGNRKASAIGTDNAMDLLEQLCSAEVEESWKRFFTYDDDFDAISAQDIQKVAKKYFNAKNMTVGRFVQEKMAKPEKAVKLKKAAKLEKAAKPEKLAKSEKLVEPEKRVEDNTAPGATTSATTSLSAQTKLTELNTDSVIGSSFSSDPGTDSGKDCSRDPGAESGKTSSIAPGTDSEKTFSIAPGTDSEKTSSIDSGADSGTSSSNNALTAASFKKRTTVKKLPNGLTVQIIPMPLVKTAAVSLTVQAGNYLATGKKSLVPQLTAALLDKGSKNASKEEAGQALEDMKAGIGFSNSNYSVAMNGKVVGKDLGKYISYVADMLRNPLFLEEELALVVEEIHTNLAQQLDDNDAMAEQKLSAELYSKDSPLYSKSFEEQLAELATITVDDLRQYHARHYSPRATTITIAGSVDIVEAMQSITLALGSWEGEAARAITLPPAIERKAATKTVVHLDNKQSATIVVALPTTTRIGTKEFFAARIANAALGEGTIDSRLGRVIRKEKSLTYGIYSQFENPYFGGGAWVIELTTDNDKVDEALTLVHEIVAKYVSEGISQEEFEQSIDEAESRFTVGLDGPSSVAKTMNLYTFLGMGIEMLDDLPKHYRAVTREEVNEYIRKTFDLSKAATIIVGSV